MALFFLTADLKGLKAALKKFHPTLHAYIDTHTSSELVVCFVLFVQLHVFCGELAALPSQPTHTQPFTHRHIYIYTLCAKNPTLTNKTSVTLTSSLVHLFLPTFVQDIWELLVSPN